MDRINFGIEGALILGRLGALIEGRLGALIEGKFQLLFFFAAGADFARVIGGFFTELTDVKDFVDGNGGALFFGAADLARLTRFGDSSTPGAGVGGKRDGRIGSR